MGAIEGGKGNYKDPITTQGGGRKEGTPSPAPVHHPHESGVAHTSTGTYGGPAAPPPNYEPSEEKDY
jgi:hypothetical protein